MQVSLSVNGHQTQVDVEPRKLLADVLRDDLRLTGTHLGCEHGACGACAVLMDGREVLSCLLFAVQAEGHEVTTIEGLGEPGALSPVQAAFMEKHGLQCGFCTPGFVVAATAYLKEEPHPTRDGVREALSGHICRCTGYQQIVDAVLAVAEEK